MIEPAAFDRLLETACRRLQGGDVHIHDAIIHGLRVRLVSDSRRLAGFWTDDWFDVQDWRERTGQVPPEGPALTVTAVGGAPAVAARPERGELLIFGAAGYEALREETLTAVRRALADEAGAYLVRAAAVVTGDGAVLGDDAFGLMGRPAARLLSVGPVVVRYAVRRRMGGWVAPVAAAEAKGWRVFDWMEKNASQGRTRVRGTREDGRPIELDLEDLDPSKTRAFAYPASRGAFVRTSVIRRCPELSGPLLHGRIEGATDVPFDFAPSDEAREDLARRAAASDAGLGSLPPERLHVVLERLLASEETRAMVDPAALFGRSRVWTNPLEPAVIGAIEWADGAAPEGEAETVLRRLMDRCLGAA